MKILSEFGWGWWVIAILLLGVDIWIIFKARSQEDKSFAVFVSAVVLLGSSFLLFLTFSMEVSSAPLQKRPYTTETIRPQKIIAIKHANVSYISKDGHVVKSTNDIFPDYSNLSTIGKVSVGQPKIVIKYYHSKPVSAFKVPDQWLATQVIVDVTVPKSQISSLYLDN